MLAWVKAFLVCLKSYPLVVAGKLEQGPFCERILSCFDLKVVVHVEPGVAECIAGSRPIIFVNLNQLGHMGALASKVALHRVFCYASSSSSSSSSSHASTSAMTSLSSTTSLSSSFPPTRYVINLGWLLVPFVGWLDWRHVLVRQLPSRFALGTMQRLKKELVEGRHHACYISAEGQRSKDGKTIFPYKRGAAHLGVSTGGWLVPLVMSPSCFEAMPYGQWKVRSGKVLEITLLQPLDTAMRTPEGLTVQMRALAETKI